MKQGAPPMPELQREASFTASRATWHSASPDLSFRSLKP